MKTNSRKHDSVIACLVLAALTLWGCGKSSSLAPGMSRLSIQSTLPGALAAASGISRSALQSVSSTNISVANRDGTVAGILTLSDARVALKEIKIKLSEADADTEAEQEENGNIKFKGPIVVNLLANTVTPSLPDLRLAPGTYREVDLKLHKIKGDEDDASIAAAVPESDPLYGNSIYLAGTYTGTTAGGSVTDMPFVLAFSLDEEFKLGSGTEGFTISESAPNPIVIAFRLAKWLAFNDTTVNDKDVDFSQVVPSNAKIELTSESDGTNKKIWEVIRKAVKASADYGVDKDDDGELEESEDDDVDSEDQNDD